MIQIDITIEGGSYLNPNEWEVKRVGQTKSEQVTDIFRLHNEAMQELLMIATNSNGDCQKIAKALEQLRDIALRNLKG